MTTGQRDACLTAESMGRLAQGECQGAELAFIEKHIEACEHCRSLLESASLDSQWHDELLPVLRTPNEVDDLHGDAKELDHDDQSLESVLKLLGPTDDPHRLGRIGTYEVIGVIGRGGMGVVFKAFDAALNRFVAIKMLLPHLAASGAARKRFAREGQAAAAVIDDNVLPIYSVAEWQGVPYLVTQYSRGTTLQKRIQDQGPLELKEILRIGMQAARGLAAAHAQGLVHRDVKPSNILLDGTVERALLTDFGLARAVDDASITRTGIIAGTPQYMSPEQARGGSVDARSDLFGLGCVLYAMCTGRPPFRAENSYAVLRLITDAQPRPIQEINPDIPDWFCGLVGRLMAKSPDERFESADEVAAFLEGALAHVQQPATVELPQQLQIARRVAKGGRCMTWSRTAIAAGMGVSVVVLLGIIFGWPRHPLIPPLDVYTSEQTNRLASRLPPVVQTAEWIRILKAEAHANYVFVEMKWEVSQLPCHERVLFHGPDWPATEGDVAVARENNASGVVSRMTNPVFAVWNNPSTHINLRRFGFRLPDKETAEKAVAQIRAKQGQSESETLAPLRSDEVFTLFRVEHEGRWYQGGMDILPGKSDIGNEFLCLHYSVPDSYDLTAIKKLESVAGLNRHLIKVTLEPTSQPKPSARIFRLDHSVSDVEENRLIQFAQLQIKSLDSKPNEIDIAETTAGEHSDRIAVGANSNDFALTVHDPKTYLGRKNVVLFTMKQLGTSARNAFLEIQFHCENPMPFVWTGPAVEADAVLFPKHTVEWLGVGKETPLVKLPLPINGYRLAFIFPSEEAALLAVKQLTAIGDQSLLAVQKRTDAVPGRMQDDGVIYGSDPAIGKYRTTFRLIERMGPQSPSINTSNLPKADDLSTRPDDVTPDLPNGGPGGPFAPANMQTLPGLPVFTWRRIYIGRASEPQLAKRYQITAAQHHHLQQIFNPSRPDTKQANQNVDEKRIQAAIQALLTIDQDRLLRRDIWVAMNATRLRTPAVHEQLGLSNEQRQQINEIWIKLEAEIQKHQGMRADGTDSYERVFDDTFEVLTSKQRRLYLFKHQDHVFHSGTQPVPFGVDGNRDDLLVPEAEPNKLVEVLKLHLRRERERFPLLDLVSEDLRLLESEDGGIDVLEKPVRADREQFTKDHPDRAKAFEAWQNDYRDFIRVTEVIPELFDENHNAHEMMVTVARLLIQAEDLPGISKERLVAAHQELGEYPTDKRVESIFLELARDNLPNVRRRLRESGADVPHTGTQEDHLLLAEEAKTHADFARIYCAIENSEMFRQIRKLQESADPNTAFLFEESHPIAQEKSLVFISSRGREEVRAGERGYHALMEPSASVTWKVGDQEFRLKNSDAAEITHVIIDRRMEGHVLWRCFGISPRKKTDLDSKNLQGTWILFRSIATDGTIDDVMALPGPVIHFDVNSGWLKWDPNGEQKKFTFDIDATKSTATIDLKFAEGIKELGVIELQDGKLSLRLGALGENRPESLTSKESTANVRQYRRLEE